MCEAPAVARWNVPSRGIQTSALAGSRPLRLVLRTQPRSFWLRLRRAALYRLSESATQIEVKGVVATFGLPVSQVEWSEQSFCAHE